ncbi:sensor histidine kinase [Sciscionella sediminilitoris]|uniref:sensor histidine kinase n=1 Tax=Sciscionella sediminilitoris TaxID=1445613 RepID=UPI000562C77A|nr:HAMP domain-containing sensor histidine kinase [Sciscionella sp. SE31]
MSRPTLRRRLTMLTAGMVAIAVVGLSLGVWLLLRIQLYDEVESSVREKVARMTHRMDPMKLATIPVWIRPDIDTLFGVVSRQGVTQRPGFQRERLPVGPVDIAIAKRQQRDSVRKVTVGDTDYLMLTVRGETGQAIQIARDLTETDQTLQRFAVVLVAADAVVVVLTVSLGYALTRRGLRSVESVRRAAEHVAQTQDLTAAVPVARRDPAEMASVARSVNAMLTALATSQDAQRQLVDDAGHELATPLTSLRTNIELLLRAEKHPERVLAAEDRRKLLEDLRAQIGELTTLTEEVVELARDQGAHEEHTELDLASVLDAAVSRARARTPDVPFEVSSEPVTVHGKRAALERALLNLLDNAAKFSPDGERVEVWLRPGENTAAIGVADRGPGVSEEELDRVFERFHRSADARALPGSGLGLSIVAQIVAAHDGSTWLTHREGGGTVAHIELPLADR